MAEPIREQVLAKLVLVLQAMTGVRPWGGTYPAPPTVERVHATALQITMFPRIEVIERAGSTRDVIVGVTGYLHRFRVNLTGYVIGTPGIASSTWHQRMAQDIFLTLVGNPTLNGLARDISFDGQSEEFLTLEVGAEMPGEAGDIRGFRQPVMVLIDEEVSGG